MAFDSATATIYLPSATLKPIPPPTPEHPTPIANRLTARSKFGLESNGNKIKRMSERAIILMFPFTEESGVIVAPMNS
jgi:hypothetical protein